MTDAGPISGGEEDEENEEEEDEVGREPSSPRQLAGLRARRRSSPGCFCRGLGRLVTQV